MHRSGLLCIVVAACTCISACSIAPQKRETAPLGPGEIASAAAARAAVAVGKSTKADVSAALGEATVIDFDSGYAVWVYRERPTEKAEPAATEFVLLFAPSGILAKTRIR